MTEFFIGFACFVMGFLFFGIIIVLDEDKYTRKECRKCGIKLFIPKNIDFHYHHACDADKGYLKYEKNL